MQYNRENPITAPHPGAEFAADVNQLLEAMLSTHRGTSRPENIGRGGLWINELDTPDRDRLYYHDGTDDIELLTVDQDTGAVTLGPNILSYFGTASTRDVGTDEDNLVEVLADGKLPALDASNLTNLDFSGSAIPLPSSKRVAKLQANLSQGGAYRCAGVIMGDGSLRIWGSADYGQLGLGSTNLITRRIPEAVPNIMNSSAPVKWISAGDCHWVLLEDGSIYTWGRNNYGECGVNSTAQLDVPEPADSGLTGVTIVDIAVGNSYYSNVHTVLVLSDDGRMFSVGYGVRGALGDGTIVTKSTFTEIGTGQTWAKIYSFASGGFGWCAAITTGGDLYTWGYNQYGMLGVGDLTDRTTPTHVNSFGGVAVDHVSGSGGDGVPSGNQGHGHMLALLTDGKVYSWGRNDYGQLGLGSAVIAGFDTPQHVTALGTDNEQVMAVAGYEGSSYVLKTGNTVYSAGHNSRGQLGRNGTAHSNAFDEMTGANYDTIEQILGCGGVQYTSFFIRYSDGTIKGCGYGAQGQLGRAASTHDNPLLENVILDKSRFKAVDMCVYGRPSAETSLGILTDKGQFLMTGYAGAGQTASIELTGSSVPHLITF